MLNQAGKHIACAAQANSNLGRAPSGEAARAGGSAGDATIVVDTSHQAGQSEHDVGAKVALYLTADQLRVFRR